MIENAISEKSDFAYEGHFRDTETLKTPRKFKRNGYEVSMIFMGLTDPHQTKTEEVKRGEISIYLGPELVDLSKKVKLYYKGNLVYNKKPRLDENALVESCGLFGDPERLYPAKIKVIL